LPRVARRADSPAGEYRANYQQNSSLSAYAEMRFGAFCKALGRTIVLGRETDLMVAVVALTRNWVDYRLVGVGGVKRTVST
jgi:hypothetical protein